MNTDLNISKLNKKQLEAVQELNGKIKVVAGAGAGKTRVLATRYAHLVNDIGVDPAHILCMTFTNKAAQEMKNRIAKIVTTSAHVNDFVCTIHGFCVKVLRREIHRLGFPSNFTILDEEDSKAFAKQVMEEFGIDSTAITVKQFLSNISSSKRNCEYIEKMLPNHILNEDSQFQRYLKLQTKYFSIDFQDIINFVIYIFGKYPDAREYWQELIDFVMVDEVQDCNQKQWIIINYVSAKNDNLFIVGDPDQAIYEWLGAIPSLFINYKADKTIILNQNYRSTPNILDVANSIISHNKNRIPKDLYTHIKPANIVVHYHAPSENDESIWVQKQIELLVKSQDVDYDDIAILYRASYLSRIFEQALIKSSIPYTVWGGVRFFERKEIKDSLAYLRLVANKDDMAFKRVINVPPRRFGNATLKKLATIAENENTNLLDALTNHLEDKEFSKTAYGEFCLLIERYRSLKDSLSISELFDNLLYDSGLKEMIRMDGDEDRINNLEELINSIKYYEELHKEDDEISLDKYLQDIALYTNADYKKDTHRVKLMTIHQAKGLEFKYVFVVGLTEGIFPSHKSIRDRKKNGEEEERRLMYVALTRAENALFLTESEGYNMSTHGGKYPSRFLNEIKSELIQVEGNLDPSLLEGTKSLVTSLDNEIMPTAKLEDYAPGNKVFHETLGEGTILKNDANQASCYVDFNGKKINLSYAVLKVIKEKITSKNDSLTKKVLYWIANKS